MKNPFIPLFFFVLGIVACYFYFQIRTSTSVVSSLPTPTITLTPAPSATPSIKIDENLGIRLAFAQKYNKKIDDVKVIISLIELPYAKGGISFAGEMGGGWYLAYKTGTVWKIVQDGNGIVSCEAIAPYNFPVTFVPECVNQNGQIQKNK